MTTKDEWIEYTGSDEQIAEIKNARFGAVFRCFDKEIRLIEQSSLTTWHFIKGLSELREKLNEMNVVEYLLCAPHPLRQIIIEQVQTGQPVHVRVKNQNIKDLCLPEIEMESTLVIDQFDGLYTLIYVTTTPNWNIPEAEYSFTPFE